MKSMEFKIVFIKFMLLKNKKNCKKKPHKTSESRPIERTKPRPAYLGFMFFYILLRSR